MKWLLPSANKKWHPRGVKAGEARMQITLPMTAAGNSRRVVDTENRTLDIPTGPVIAKISPLASSRNLTNHQSLTQIHP